MRAAFFLYSFRICFLFKQFTGDNEFLYFAGSFSNGTQFAITIKFLYRKILGITVTAKICTASVLTLTATSLA